MLIIKKCSSLINVTFTVSFITQISLNTAFSKQFFAIWMWIKVVTKSPSSASSTHREGPFDECLLVTAKRKNWYFTASSLYLLQLSLTDRKRHLHVITLQSCHEQWQTPPCNSQKGHRKTNMVDGNKTPVLVQPPSRLAHEKDLEFLEKGDAYISRNPPLLKNGCVPPTPTALFQLSLNFPSFSRKFGDNS